MNELVNKTFNLEKMFADHSENVMKVKENLNMFIEASNGTVENLITELQIINESSLERYQILSENVSKLNSSSTENLQEDKILEIHVNISQLSENLLITINKYEKLQQNISTREKEINALLTNLGENVVQIATTIQPNPTEAVHKLNYLKLELSDLTIKITQNVEQLSSKSNFNDIRSKINKLSIDLSRIENGMTSKVINYLYVDIGNALAEVKDTVDMFRNVTSDSSSLEQPESVQAHETQQPATVANGLPEDNVIKITPSSTDLTSSRYSELALLALSEGNLTSRIATMLEDTGKVAADFTDQIVNILIAAARSKLVS